MIYDRFTRLMHMFIASGMVVQMIVSLVMIHPKPGRQGDTFYAFHETYGQVLLGLLLLHWIWCMVRSGNIAFSQLFPWFSWPRYRAIFEDIKLYASHAAQFSLPNSTQQASPLASAVQGLGLFVAMLLGVSGAIMYFAMAKNGAMIGWVHAVKEIHEILGSLMWVYLVVHATMAIVHQLAGHGSMRAMIMVWEKNPQTKN